MSKQILKVKATLAGLLYHAPVDRNKKARESTGGVSLILWRTPSIVDIVAVNWLRVKCFGYRMQAKFLTCILHYLPIYLS